MHGTQRVEEVEHDPAALATRQVERAAVVEVPVASGAGRRSAASRPLAAASASAPASTTNSPTITTATRRRSAARCGAGRRSPPPSPLGGVTSSTTSLTPAPRLGRRRHRRWRRAHPRSPRRRAGPSMAIGAETGSVGAAPADPGNAASSVPTAMISTADPQPQDHRLDEHPDRRRGVAGGGARVEREVDVLGEPGPHPRRADVGARC